MTILRPEGGELRSDHWRVKAAVQIVLRDGCGPKQTKCEHCHGQGKVGGGFKSLEGPQPCPHCEYSSGWNTDYSTLEPKPDLPEDLILHLRNAFEQYLVQKEKHMIYVKSSIPEVWEASYNSDSTEGRGRQIIAGYFIHKADAEAAVKNLGVMGTPGDVRKIPTPSFTIFESLEEYHAGNREEIRQKALRKLTAEEIEALDLPVMARGEAEALGLVAKLRDNELMVPLTYRNNWETNEYYAGGQRLGDGELKALKAVYIDGLPYNVRTRKHTGYYSDHGHPGEATSLLLEAMIPTQSVLGNTWTAVHTLISPARRIEIKVVKPR